MEGDRQGFSRYTNLLDAATVLAVGYGAVYAVAFGYTYGYLTRLRIPIQNIAPHGEAVMGAVVILASIGLVVLVISVGGRKPTAVLSNLPVMLFAVVGVVWGLRRGTIDFIVMTGIVGVAAIASTFLGVSLAHRMSQNIGGRVLVVVFLLVFGFMVAALLGDVHGERVGDGNYSTRHLVQRISPPAVGRYGGGRFVLAWQDDASYYLVPVDTATRRRIGTVTLRRDAVDALETQASGGRP